MPGGELRAGLMPTAPELASGEVPRPHAADAVLDRLAEWLCRGGVEPGAALPPERELAERFGVSRPIVRQATHRLATIGLLRVRQGGATVAADPRTASHPDALALRLRFGGLSVREVHERQIVAPLPLLGLAERRATEESVRPLVRAVDAMEAGEDLGRFEDRFWTAVADLTGSELIRGDAAFWFGAMRAAPALRHPELGDLAARLVVYREVVRRLVGRGDAAAFWLEVARVGLARLDALAQGGAPGMPR